jgi:uncharacterized protein
MEYAKEKELRLIERLKEMGSAAIAFSGGVDSTYLLKTAFDALGDRAVACTAKSSSFPKRELGEAVAFCESEGIRHFTFEANELEVAGFRENPANRCYLCKAQTFGQIRAFADREGIPHVCDGSNADDGGDYRPGLKALEEQGILSPLRDAGLTKGDIRLLSKEKGLSTWDKPSFACLASRFPYGEEITEEKLKMVSDAEDALFALGLRQVRVRFHAGGVARIETEEEGFQLLSGENARKGISQALKAIGFSYVALDLAGYRSGSLNEVLGQAAK